MRFPLSLVLSTALYVLKGKIVGKERFPLVLALEPTHRCNLFCQGCGRIREYRDSFGQILTLEQALTAVDEVRAPVVAITGGEPLLYPEIDVLVREILKRRRHLFLATNGILLQGFLERVHPHPRLNLVLHLDGLAETHDRLCGRPGTFERVIEGIREAKRRNFRVVTNTVIYKGTTVDELEVLFAYLDALQVDGMLVTPAFSPPGLEGDLFPTRDEVHRRSRAIHALADRFKLLGTPLYFKCLKGERALPCTPWGYVTLVPQGWKSPCVFLTDRYYGTFKELMEQTPWDRYGAGKDPRCEHCLFHGGIESTITLGAGFGSFKDVLEMARWYLS